jgi:glutathione S-transferase
MNETARAAGSSGDFYPSWQDAGTDVLPNHDSLQRRIGVVQQFGHDARHDLNDYRMDMTGKRLLIHSVFLFLLPLIVAWFGISFAGALFLVLATLLWRWAITISGIVAPAGIPALELETISASHFVEKVRWSMDRLGVDYTEKPVGGTLGVFYAGRTVPQLKIRTGMVRSVIGDSPAILRYLWGACHAEKGDNAAFLEPTEARLALEKKLDRYGFNLQVWVYYHILQDRGLTLHAWGRDDPALPRWQRIALNVLFPIQRALIRMAFRISDKHFAGAVEHIEIMLADIERQLADGRDSILGSKINFSDIAFAAFSGLWLLPENYGGGKADAVRVERSACPAAMQQDIERWIGNYPHATAFVERLYAEER